MNKRKIEKKYLEKITLLNDYNKNYYDLSSPLVSDAIYDELKKKNRKFRKQIFFS